MRNHQADRSGTVGEPGDTQSPGGAMLRVDRQLCMTVYPVLQFGAW
ncbi:Uncharacterised protein [Mycobacteroides abscessus subsp. abscessus]|nr:Uncharacterised protein [Mycobacteroides abscessus subsp. abscessus]